jgi:hypothetical protein
MADKKISVFNNATLPLSGAEVLPIVQGGETKKILASDLGGASKKSFVLEYPLVGGGTATTNWWTITSATGNMYLASYANVANLTPVDNFAFQTEQRLAKIVPFGCKLTHVSVRSWSNTGQGNLDLVVLGSTQIPGLSGVYIQNPQILARETFSTTSGNTSTNMFYHSFDALNIENINLAENSAISILYNNNGTAMNFLLGHIVMHFEEI